MNIFETGTNIHLKEMLRVIESQGNQGRSQDFSKGGGGHTVSNIIVMAFSSRNIIGCLLKEAYKGGSRAPQDPPR